jgi:chemotaxis protein CheZ
VERELGKLLREICDQHLVAAVDELNEIVRVTEDTTNTILEEAEEIDNGGMITDSVAKIYEACSFQDITGQRIGKVVVALKNSRIVSIRSRSRSATS